VGPDGFRTIPCPTYPEIRLALLPGRKLAATLDALAPDAVHVATEGPLGIAARHYCGANRLSFTTSYHTQFPQYVRKRVPIPESWSYAYLRRHHGRARRTLVATEHQRRDLVAHGFENVVLWSRGVDAELFKPGARDVLSVARPIWMYAGRVAVEKNLDAFLSLELPGTKVVVGDGPDRAELARRHPGAVFAGYKFGAELAGHLSAADVFVFPSRTDTFGLVMLEAMACGTPVAAFPVTGPIDVVTPGVDGALDEDLARAAFAALDVDRGSCRRSALGRTWERASAQFLSHLVRTRDGRDLVAAAAV
jgi:glycosyltransferase involved in cell wall biosynthesis